MAIAVDATSETAGSTGTTLTLSHTCTGTDLVLIVSVLINGADPTGVTYNGVAMTLEDTISFAGGNTSSVWSLDDPSTGANNIVATKGSGHEIAMGGISFTGADTTGATASGTDFSDSPSVTVTTTGDVGFVVDALWCGNPPTEGASQTVFMAQNDFGGGGRRGFASYESYTGGGNPVMSWTQTASFSWGLTAVEVIEAATSTFKPSAIFY